MGMNSAEIQGEFDAKLGEITGGLESVKDGLRSVVADGQHPADVTVDALHSAFDEADGEYQAAVEERNRKLKDRAAELRQALFGAPAGSAGAAFTNALTEAASAGDDQLTALAELAATTNDKTLGKAVFAAAVQRGRADLGIPWLEGHPEMGRAFAELGTMPTADELERGRAFRFPRPSLADLRPQAHEIFERERQEAARRVQRAMQGG